MQNHEFYLLYYFQMAAAASTMAAALHCFNYNSIARTVYIGNGKNEGKVKRLTKKHFPSHETKNGFVQCSPLFRSQALEGRNCFLMNVNYPIRDSSLVSVGVSALQLQFPQLLGR